MVGVGAVCGAVMVVRLADFQNPWLGELIGVSLLTLGAAVWAVTSLVHQHDRRGVVQAGLLFVATALMARGVLKVARLYRTAELTKATERRLESERERPDR